jgi:hypothetical protein
MSQSQGSNIMQGIQSVGNTIAEKAQDIGSAVAEKAQDIGEQAKNIAVQPMQGSPSMKDFLFSNNLISKFVFLIVVIFAFVIILKLGLALIGFIFRPNRSPHLIDGMLDAKQGVVFPQNPSDKNAKTIYRSNNQRDGLEFTWSVWIFINDLQYMQGSYKQVFYKGNNQVQSNGMNSPNNAPGLYIAPNTNALVVVMNSYDKVNEELTIPDIPLNKWVNVIIRCQNTTLDVFVNGTITRSMTLSGVPKQNYGEVYVAMNGGFDGFISNLWYYNRALSTVEITSISSRGPSTKVAKGSDVNNTKSPNYLSLRWYTGGL